MVSAILLAAGSSQRMGDVNKLLLPWQDGTVLSATAGRLLEAGIEEVILVTGHQPDEIKKAVRSLPVSFIHNRDYATGMTSSIRAGVAVARGDGFMICLADMVLITPEEYALLADAFRRQYALDDHCIILPDFQGATGNPVIFSVAWRQEIIQHPDKEGC
ncbi:MAG TPA: nucleotidyltransferase family protein, partial [Puia sp.]|nr:nucleotidyltransferase family protein [Puia sp.]